MIIFRVLNITVKLQTQISTPSPVPEMNLRRFYIPNPKTKDSNETEEGIMTSLLVVISIEPIYTLMNRA